MSELADAYNLSADSRPADYGSAALRHAEIAAHFATVLENEAVMLEHDAVEYESRADIEVAVQRRCSLSVAQDH